MKLEHCPYSQHHPFCLKLVPFTLFFVLIFFFSLAILFFAIQVDVIALAFAEIGIPSHYVLFALFASLLGSFINIPVKRLPQKRIAPQETFLPDVNRLGYFRKFSPGEALADTGH